MLRSLQGLMNWNPYLAGAVEPEQGAIEVMLLLDMPSGPLVFVQQIVDVLTFGAAGPLVKLVDDLGFSPLLAPDTCFLVST